MWIGHPIPELRLFQNLTLQTKGQGHGRGYSSKSKCGYNNLSTHIPFVPCQSGIPFLSCDFFKIWPWKSRVNVMGGVTVQSHNVGLTSYRFTSLSFHVNRPSHSWDTAFQNLTLKIKVQGQMTMMLHNYRSRQFHRTSNGTDPSRGFRDMGSAKSGPSAAWFDKFLAHGKPIWGKWANNYDSAQLQVQTSPWNFKWGQSIQRFQRYAFHKVWPMGKPIWVKWPWQCTTTGLDNSTELRTENSINRLQRYGFRKFGSRPPGLPPARTVTTIPLQPWGLRGKN